MSAEREYIYEVGTDLVVKRCVNFLPHPDGCPRKIEPTKNAIIIQCLPIDGVDELKRMISIECRDMDLLPLLEEEARRIIDGG